MTQAPQSTDRTDTNRVATTDDTPDYDTLASIALTRGGGFDAGFDAGIALAVLSISKVAGKTDVRSSHSKMVGAALQDVSRRLSRLLISDTRAAIDQRYPYIGGYARVHSLDPEVTKQIVELAITTDAPRDAVFYEGIAMQGPVRWTTLSEIDAAASHRNSARTLASALRRAVIE